VRQQQQARSGGGGPARSGSVSFRVPDSDSDDGGGGGSDGDDGATSGLTAPARSAATASVGSRARRAPGPVHAVHLARTRQLRQQVQADASAAAGALEAELLQIEADLVEQLQRVALEAEDKQVRGCRGGGIGRGWDEGGFGVQRGECVLGCPGPGAEASRG
jgi:hypothetical protein